MFWPKQESVKEEKQSFIQQSGHIVLFKTKYHYTVFVDRNESKQFGFIDKWTKVTSL